MPTYRQITIEVTDGEGKPLPEFAVTTRDRARLAFCHIESKAGMTFCIRLQPHLPFKRPHTAFTDSSVFPQSLRNPWHLLATMRIDGRKGFEKRRIIVLDTYHPEYKGRDGEVFMTSRTMRDSQGKLQEVSWRFQDVGIEAFFDELKLSTGGDDKAESELIAALADLRADLPDPEEKNGVGQIEIVLERVTLGPVKENFWVDQASAEADLSVSAGHAKDVAQTVARDDARPLGKTPSTIQYDLVDPDARPYATFKFYYRNKAVLKKLGMLDNPSEEKAVAAGAGVLGGAVPGSKRGKGGVGEEWEGEEEETAVAVKKARSAVLSFAEAYEDIDIPL